MVMVWEEDVAHRRGRAKLGRRFQPTSKETLVFLAMLYLII